MCQHSAIWVDADTHLVKDVWYQKERERVEAAVLADGLVALVCILSHEKIFIAIIKSCVVLWRCLSIAPRRRGTAEPAYYPAS